LRQQRLQAVLAAALLACAAGGLLHLAQPINKQLWTPAFVLFSAGLSALLLLLAHALVERQGLPPFGRSFGVNAIAAYAGAWVMAVVIDAVGCKEGLYDAVFGRLQPLAGPQAQSLAYALAFVAAWALLVRFLDARRWYWKL
jgi:predicted acyltransferase